MLFTIQDFLATCACPENRVCPENFQGGRGQLPSPAFPSLDGWNHARDLPWARKDCKVLLFCMLNML